MKAFILKINPEGKLLEQWDFGLMLDFLNGNLWKTANWHNFEIEEVEKLPETDTAIVFIAGRHNAGFEKTINKQLSKIKKVVFFVMGDEEGVFNLDLIEHKNIYKWVQNPNPNKHDAYFRIGTGYPKRMKFDKEFKAKDINLFFSGQITHNRRKDMQYTLDTDMANYYKEVNYTDGFTKGYEPDIYYDLIQRTVIMPCPSGAVVPDSFRLFEALEGMAIPIADEVSPDGTITNYWDWLFKQITPFPKITDWFSLLAVYNEAFASQIELRHKITAWYIKYKRDLAYKIMEQLQ